MKPRQLITLAAAAWFAAVSVYATAQPAPKAKPTRDSNTSIEATSDADSLRTERDRPPIARDFVQQPPLIPHTIRGYNITQNFN